MTVTPALMAVTLPVEETVATTGLLLLHVPAPKDPVSARVAPPQIGPSPMIMGVPLIVSVVKDEHPPVA